MSVDAYESIAVLDVQALEPIGPGHDGRSTAGSARIPFRGGAIGNSPMDHMPFQAHRPLSTDDTSGNDQAMPATNKYTVTGTDRRRTYFSILRRLEICQVNYRQMYLNLRLRDRNASEAQPRWPCRLLYACCIGDHKRRRNQLEGAALGRV